jgi:hypothetical protein
VGDVFSINQVMSLPEQWISFAPKPMGLTGVEQWNVFLSYRSVNRAWVLNLYDVLQHQGTESFWINAS